MTDRELVERLKPCPFCGSPAVRLVSGAPGCHYVLCEGCRASSDDCSRERAVTKWNTRIEALGSTQPDGELVERVALAMAKEIGWGTFSHFNPDDMRRVASAAIAAGVGSTDDGVGRPVKRHASGDPFLRNAANEILKRYATFPRVKWEDAVAAISETLRVAANSSEETDRAAIAAGVAGVGSTLMRDALDDLQQAEAEYRLMHDRHGDGASATGRAWDRMRLCGDKARAALAQGGSARL